MIDQKFSESEKLNDKRDVLEILLSSIWSSRMSCCQSSHSADKLECSVSNVKLEGQFEINLEVLRGQRIQECHHALVKNITVQYSSALLIKKLRKKSRAWIFSSSFSSHYVRLSCAYPPWNMEFIICNVLVCHGKKFT